MRLDEAPNDVENSVMSYAVPTKLQSLRTVVEDVLECLPGVLAEGEGVRGSLSP